jgi:predicted RND superfamily exporter protein
VPTLPDRTVNWLSEHMVRWRWGLLLVAMAATLLSYEPASRLTLDESIESFFSPDDPLLLRYEVSKQCFGGDEFVLVAYTPAAEPGSSRPPNLTSNAVLDETAAFADELSRVPGVQASSTQHLRKMFRPPEVPPILIRLITGSLLDQARGILVGEDGQTIAIVLRLLPAGQSPVSRRETIRQLREVAARHTPKTYIAGEPVQVQDMFLSVEQDSLLLGVTSSILLMLVIVGMFRSLRWMVLPLLVVQPALMWTKGLLASTGIKLSMVSSMLSSLTTIIGVATVMHVAVEFRSARARGDRYAAFREVVRKLAIPIFWTIVTTAVGFGSLLTSSITPVRSFGLMMLVATLLVAVACLVFLPAGILIGSVQSDPRHSSAEDRLTLWLGQLFEFVTTRRWTTINVLVCLTSAACVGLEGVQVETDFSQNFRKDSPIIESLDYFESRFGGAGTWEVNFSAPAELDEAYLDKVRKLAEELRKVSVDNERGQGQLTKVVALTDGLDFIPKLRAPTLEDRRELMRQMQPEYEPALYNHELGRMRIVLRARERQPAEVKLALLAKVRSLARETFPDAEVTGLYVLLSSLIQSLLRDQIVSFGLSILLIIVCVWIPFRRLSWALIAMFPNVLPTLWLIGGMGWIGMPINIGTAMIASVSLGLTIDSSIHYLAGYQRARQAGKSHHDALKVASTEIGKALVLANVALVIGFSVLSLSNFLPLVYFGVLVSFAMLSGLAGNLILLPSLMLGLEEDLSVEAGSETESVQPGAESNAPQPPGI